MGGGADPPPFVDPGTLVRYGIPVSSLLVNLGVAGTLGSLVFACFALTPGERAFERAVDVAAASSGVWAIASGAMAFFLFQSLYTDSPSLDNAYGQALGTFLTEVSAGQAWLTVTLVAAATTAVCFAVRNIAALAGVVGMVVLGLLPIAQQGHAGGTADHDIAVSAIWLHIIFVAIWLGGLLAMVLIRPLLDSARLTIVLARYSSLALICFIVVAISGYVSAAIRVGDLAALNTPYGFLVIVKVFTLIVLGGFGALQRRFMITRLGTKGTQRWFVFLVSAELVFMGVAAGVAAALARTAPPVEEIPASEWVSPTPAEYLTGAALPPELTPARFLTEWKLELLWALVVIFAMFFYLAGMWRLYRRGDNWPWYRLGLWSAASLLLLWVTNGAPAVYEKYLFSVHMLGHMILTMAIPILFVFGAPITLAARAIRARTDGSRGVREWILWVTHSPYLRLLTNPFVAAALFALSLWAFYYTGIFRWAVTDHVGHLWMILHFVLVGYLFALVLVGVDPLPNRPPHALRLVLLLVTMAFHAFFGLSIMSNDGLMLADWYGAMGRIWGDPPLVDQHAGGGIAWSVGEIPTVILAIAVAIQWARHDEREAKRLDRAADRDGEAELAAYNAMLHRRAKKIPPKF